MFECYVEHERGKTYNSVAAGFCITDCSRKIELDFYAGDKECEINGLYKIDMLINELRAFKASLLEAYAAADFKEEE